MFFIVIFEIVDIPNNTLMIPIPERKFLIQNNTKHEAIIYRKIKSLERFNRNLLNSQHSLLQTSPHVASSRRQSASRNTSSLWSSSWPSRCSCSPLGRRCAHARTSRTWGWRHWCSTSRSAPCTPWRTSRRTQGCWHTPASLQRVHLPISTYNQGSC